MCPSISGGEAPLSVVLNEACGIRNVLEPVANDVPRAGGMGERSSLPSSHPLNPPKSGA